MWQDVERLGQNEISFARSASKVADPDFALLRVGIGVCVWLQFGARRANPALVSTNGTSFLRLRHVREYKEGAREAVSGPLLLSQNARA